MGRNRSGPKAPTVARGWRWLILSSAALLFFCVLVLLLEGVLWAAGSETLLSERDPFRGFSSQVRVYEKSPDGQYWQTRAQARRHSFNAQRFRVDKADNGTRIFVLGGSSTYGFPWGAPAAFPSHLERALAQSYPERAFEVINAGGMSYGSHRLRILVHELMDYEPDLLVIYGAHNELTERSFYRKMITRSQELDRVRLVLYGSHFYSALVKIGERLRGRGERFERDAGGQSTGQMLGFDVEREISERTLDSDKRKARERFEENLSAILDLAESHGVPVVLSTVVSNYRDWLPDHSIFREGIQPQVQARALQYLEQGKQLLESGDAAGAVKQLESARSLAPGHAHTLFRLAQAYEALERWQDARRYYSLACDADAQPTRAPSAMNETIRKLARVRGALLVDAARSLEEAAPHGLVGFNLIEDYVHPNRRGHKLIALAMWRALVASGLLGLPREEEPARFWAAIGEPGGGSELASADLLPSEAQGEDGAKTPAVLYNLGLVFENKGFADRAIEEYRKCLELDPRYYGAAYNLGRLLAEGGRPDLAISRFRQVLALQPEHMRSLVALGMALTRVGKPQEAEKILARAVEIQPDSAAAWNGLGYVQAMQRRLPEAIAAFRKAIANDPDHVGALGNLGSALLLDGQAAEAVSIFRRSLVVRQGDPTCTAGLADALAANGESAEAERIYRAILQADPKNRRAREGLQKLGARP